MAKSSKKAPKSAAARNKKLRDRRRAAGLCLRCCKRTFGKSVHCDACAEKLHRQTYQQNKAAGVCTQCWQPIDRKGALCTACLDRRRQKRRLNPNANTENSRKRYAAYKAAGMCARCGRPPAKPGAQLCAACVADRTAANKRMYARRKAAGLCIKCGQRPATKKTVLCDSCRAYHLAGRRKFYQKLKEAAFQAYGGYKCACPGCDVTEPQFLQIDHLLDDGAIHREVIGRGGLYAWLKKHNYPPGFQVLCANCNFAKGHYGMCPHMRQFPAEKPAIGCPSRVG